MICSALEDTCFEARQLAVQVKEQAEATETIHEVELHTTKGCAARVQQEGVLAERRGCLFSSAFAGSLC